MMTRDMLSKSHPLRGLTTALIVVVLFGMLAAPAGADNDSIRLGIDAVGSDLPYFDLTLEPGDSVDLTVRFSNYGNVSTGASIFAADVRTIRGGGMGMADIDDDRTGATTWLDFEDEDLKLASDDQIERTVTVTVPEDTDSGEYITSVVIQNTEPVDIGDNDARFDQTVRQAVAIAIDVPGDRPAQLRVGDAHHLTSGERSVVEVGLENIGQAHLRPEGSFALADTDGETLAASSIALDTFYAGTDTVIEVTFTDQLPPGDYRIRLSLEDPETGARVEMNELPLSVAEEDRETGADDDAGAGIVGATSSAGQDSSSFPGWTVIFGGLMVLFGLMVVLAVVIVLRLRRRPAMAIPAAERPDVPEPVAPPEPVSPQPDAPRKPMRQLVPPGREL